MPGPGPKSYGTTFTVLDRYLEQEEDQSLTDSIPNLNINVQPVVHHKLMWFEYRIGDSESRLYIFSIEQMKIVKYVEILFVTYNHLTIIQRKGNHDGH